MDGWPCYRQAQLTCSLLRRRMVKNKHPTYWSKGRGEKFYKHDPFPPPYGGELGPVPQEQPGERVPCLVDRMNHLFKLPSLNKNLQVPTALTSISSVNTYSSVVAVRHCRRRRDQQYHRTYLVGQRAAYRRPLLPSFVLFEMSTECNSLRGRAGLDGRLARSAGGGLAGCGLRS